MDGVGMLKKKSINPINQKKSMTSHRMNTQSHAHTRTKTQIYKNIF